MAAELGEDDLAWSAAALSAKRVRDVNAQPGSFKKVKSICEIGSHSLSKDLTGAGNESGLRYRLLVVGRSGSSVNSAPARVSEEYMTMEDSLEGPATNVAEKRESLLISANPVELTERTAALLGDAAA